MTDEQPSESETPVSGSEEAEKARTSLEAAIALQAAPGPERFFGEYAGLLAEVLREAVTDTLLLARAPGRELYIYRGGVWKPGGNDAVSARVVELLADRNRATHAKLMVENIILTTPYAINDEPHPGWINFRNGMLDWRTGNLHPHNPELMSINQVPYDWDPNATCPRTDRFMSEVFHADAAALGYEMIGYAMYDGNPLQKAAMLVGSGANGKGVFLNLVDAVLGEENVSAVPLQSLTDNRFAAADLYGRLANVAGDLSSKPVEDTSAFKMITGGDLIRAERKFRDAFTFKAQAFPMFSANELPGSADTSTGYLRRWLVVEFPRTFRPEERDAGLSEVLASERAGVAGRAVAALRDVMDRGCFTEVESVIEAQNEMAIALNPIKEFFDDCIEIDPNRITPRSVIYQAYLVWCARTGRDHPLGERRFWGKFRTEMMSKTGMTVWDKKLERRTSSDRSISGVCVTDGGGPFGGTS
jgi:P4 family phage/plasmid primase-like protien